MGNALLLNIEAYEEKTLLRQRQRQLVCSASQRFLTASTVHDACDPASAVTACLALLAEWARRDHPGKAQSIPLWQQVRREVPVQRMASTRCLQPLRCCACLHPQGFLQDQASTPVLWQGFSDNWAVHLPIFVHVSAGNGSGGYISGHMLPKQQVHMTHMSHAFHALNFVPAHAGRLSACLCHLPFPRVFILRVL